jgi:hypothetical protein
VASKRKPKNPHAVALGRLGGTRRAQVLSPEQRSDIGMQGGLVGGRARANSLSKARRSEIAKMAAEARWAFSCLAPSFSRVARWEAAEPSCRIFPHRCSRDLHLLLVQQLRPLRLQSSGMLSRQPSSDRCAACLPSRIASVRSGARKANGMSRRQQWSSPPLSDFELLLALEVNGRSFVSSGHQLRSRICS